MIALPPALVRNVTEVWGEDGERWLADLPALTADVAEQWGLELGPPFALSYHWVVPATRADGAEAVLKLGLPGAAHLGVEATTLGIFAGHGAVRLLGYDADRGALLLERADPGTPAAALVPEHDEEATAALVGVMRRLHVPPPRDASLPDLLTQGEAFRRHLLDHPGDDLLPRRLVERAGALFDELCASAERRVVLHGDLHHDNVLRASREPWLAIDPHGVVGDPGYETGASLFNPDPDRRDDVLLRLVPARVEQLAAELAMPRERVVAWGFVKAVLSEVWTAEDGGVPGNRALDVALLLEPELP